MSESTEASRPAILHICLSQGWGGLEMYPVRVGKGLLARDYPVFGLALAGSRVAADMTADGMQVWEVTSRFQALLQLRRLLGWLRQHNIRVLHCHKSSDLLLAALLKSFYHCRLIFTEHMGAKRSKRDLLHRWIYRHVDRVLAISDETLKRNRAALPLPPERISRLWLGTELKRCNEDPGTIRQELGIPAGLLIGMVGRFSPGKGQRELLDAFCLLRAEFADLQLLLVGGKLASEGANELFVAEIEQLITARGLQTVVHLCGFRCDTSRLLQAMDVVVIPSHNEAFGLTVIEAMASGKAIVGANTGAIPEILGDSGLLANPLNANEIASEIGLLLNAPEERYRLGSLARHRAEMAFGMPQHLDALVKIYCPE
ncbi:glycosyltransferase family 4 protein [Aeromonas fluvialis]|uniref:glycosyltransferase family 4 protein n=1 Tax=Aeromonas fluvialis TaxID=591962 RepID=UPI0006949CC4|nr:glycosyltransferase family 4 protein [Aeromonas fluvialis]